MNPILLVTVLAVFDVPVHVSTSPNSFSCRSEAGTKVDWYIIYKLPKIKTQDCLYNDGAAYAFIVGEPLNRQFNKSGGWKISKRKIRDGNSILDKTLHLAYKRSKPYSYVLYNDQPPTKNYALSHCAHAKGILVMDAESGFWITHSIPKFPSGFEASDESVFPDSGLIYGQTALCVSFNTEESAAPIIEHLARLKPHVYSSNDAQSVLSRTGSLRARIRGQPVDNRTEVSFFSIKGTKFIAYSKDSSANMDIYSGLVAPTLEEGFFVETWRTGEGKPLRSCRRKTYEVLNVNKLCLSVEHSELKWTTTQDHSKWAVSVSSKNPIFCIGDMNRKKSLVSRSGGVLCMKNRVVWKAFVDIVQETESCPA